MRRIAMTVAGMAAALLLLGSAPALAESAGLQVAGVDGRSVDLVLTLDPRLTVDEQTPTRATVEVGGVVTPATTSIEVAADTRPNTAILVLDASGSMAGARIAAARRAATGFVEAMRPDVAVGLVTFNDAVRVVVTPTRDRRAVLDAIDAVVPAGDTSLYDAVARSLALADARARVVVLSDGKDTLSKASLADAKAAVAATQTPVDVVSIRPSADELAILRSLAEVNGGSVRAASSSDDLVAAFAEASASFGARVLISAVIPDRVAASGQPITASVGVGSEVIERSAMLPVTPSLDATGSPATGSLDPAVASVQPSTASTLVAAGLAVLVAFAILLVAFMVLRARRHTREVRRIEQVLNYRTGSQYSSPRGGTAEREPNALVRSADRLLAGVGSVQRTQARLSAAEFELTPGGWLLIRLGIAAVLAVALSVVLRNAFIGIALGVALAWLGSWLVLHSRVAGRQRRFSDSLPDFLMLLASGLRAGLSFTHALESAASEDRGEVGRQIRRALREVQVGASLDSALMECANRMNNEDLRWTVTALGVQREVGGNLSTILDAAAATIKGRDELRREVRTLSAEGRLSAYILVALPLGVFAFLVVFRREYVSLLWTDPLGIIMLVGLILAMLVGWLWMRSIVRIRV